MKRIEILGASGSGKSTLYKNLKEISRDERTFMSIEEAEIAASSIDTNFFFKTYLNQEVTNRYKLGLARKIIFSGSLIDEVFNEESRNLIGEALKEKFYWKNNFKYSFNQVRRVLDIVKRYSFLETVFDDNTITLIDEGLFHATSANYLHKFKSPDIIPDGVLYCYDTPTNIYNKIMKRKNGGIMAGGHIGMSDQQLMEFVELSNRLEEEKFENLTKMGVPMVRLDMAQKPTKSVRNSLEFLKLL